MLTACLTVSLLPVIPAQAGTEQRLVGHYGDLNSDNQLTLADVGMITSWLSGDFNESGSTPEIRMEYADLDHNGRLDAVDLSIAKLTNSMEFKWHNYSAYYDNSNLKQRTLRLVNEAEGGGLFDFGQNIDGSISGFHWYDNEGYQTIDTHLTIQLGGLQPSASYIADANPWESASSSGRYPDEYLRDSWVSVTIADGSDFVSRSGENAGNPIG